MTRIIYTAHGQARWNSGSKVKAMAIKTGTFARSVFVTFGLLVAFSSSGHAGDILYHGSLCNPDRGHAWFVEYSELGVHNVTGPTTSSPQRSVAVHCGGFIDVRDTINQVSVVIFDPNPAKGAGVKCTLTVVDTGGAALFTNTQSSPTAAQPGSKQIDFFPNTAGGTIHLTCLIPPDSSHVLAYRVMTTP